MFSPQQVMSVLKKNPNAYSEIFGSKFYPSIMGWVIFYQLPEGVFVMTEIGGLPINYKPCTGTKFGFQIHEGSLCSGSEIDPFYDSDLSYNPQSCPPPYQAGNLPSLLATSNGVSYLSFFTSNFTVKDIIGRTIVVHAPSENDSVQFASPLGQTIACGKILRAR